MHRDRADTGVWQWIQVIPARVRILSAARIGTCFDDSGLGAAHSVTVLASIFFDRRVLATH